MALYTSFQDGPIQNIVAQFAGDLNPPAYSIIKNIVNQSTAVDVYKRQVPADIANNIIQLIDFQRRLTDKSLDMGELLNAATDGSGRL